MKIEIDYNGAFAVCRIEPMEELGKMVNFNEADTDRGGGGRGGEICRCGY